MIVLVGFMGAGKTTVGRLLARRLGLPFVDTDEVVARRVGSSIARLFETEGEAAFRDLEREAVAEVLAGPDAVVALGGGALGDPSTVAALEWTTVVYLDVPYPEAMRRLGADPGRPLLRLADPRALYLERAAVYERVSRLRVSTSRRTPGDVAAEIAAAVSASGDAEAIVRIPVAARDGTYEVVVGRGLLAETGGLTPVSADAEKAFVVTHPPLVHLAEPVVSSLSSAGLETHVLTVSEGERSKSLENAGRLVDELSVRGAHRDDLVLAVGGGVVGDLAGFVASIYARGIAIAQVPTTLLGQVDAGIGGKTAVNLATGKNLVGTFHQPTIVLCDVDVLATLPPQELRNGLAEVVKYALIADPDLVELLDASWDRIFAADPATLREIVVRCARIKASIVSSDELDRGERAHLNYGHTFAHALEHCSSYDGIRHGEAVAIGMMAAAYLARELDRIDDDVVDLHRRLLTSAGLPVTAELDFYAMQAAWSRDKKYRRGDRFVLLSGVGKPEADVQVPPDALRRALERVAP